MKKRGVSLIMGLMSVSLLGVIAMQVYFLTESYHQKSELFDQAVNQSLANVVSKLEKQQALYFFERKKQQFSKPASNSVMLVKNQPRPAKTPAKKAVDPTVLEQAGKAIRFARDLAKEQRRSDSLFARVMDATLSKYNFAFMVQNAPINPEQQEATLNMRADEVEDAFGNVRGTIRSQLITPGADPAGMGGVSAGRMTIRTRSNGPNGESVDVRGFGLRRAEARMDTLKVFFVRDSNNLPAQVWLRKPVIRNLSTGTAHLTGISLTPMVASSKTISKAKAKEIEDSVRLDKNQKLVSDVAKQMELEELPFKQRIAPLDSLLKSELLNHGVKTAYKTNIDTARYPKGLFRQVSNKENFPAANVYRAALFPSDLGKDGNHVLTLIFPEKSSVILSTMGAAMGTTGALSLVLVFCFGYTLHSILRQKKISEMKTDFINNMTHEFKTPVATIMIASEGLKDPDVAVDKGRVNRLAGIIYDENVRLANHIERVLNIAKIDREDLRLEHDPIEMNDLVNAVTDSMALQLQKRDAQLDLNLQAANPVVSGDELHLSNVIYNLVDNAVKYSVGRPHITITTLNSGKNFVVRVADKGIGMSRDQLSRIFEQFYRVPTGNLHDVKGFGLGLSYVNNIVKRLGGSVKVKSEKDKGSEFELSFPVA